MNQKSRGRNGRALRDAEAAALDLRGNPCSLRPVTKARKSAVIALTLALFFIVSALFLMVPAQLGLASATLEDGSIVFLDAVTFGTRHRTGPPAFPMGILRRLMPRLGIPPSRTFHTSEPSVALWWKNVAPDSPDPLDFQWFSHAVLTDEHGCEFWASDTGIYAGNAYYGNATSLPAGIRASDITLKTIFAAFPRSDREFKITLFSRVRKPAAEFTVQNPADITALPSLPDLQQRFGGVEFLLKGVRAQWKVHERNGLLVELPVLRPEIEVTENGTSTTNWSMSDVQLLDALGNPSSASAYTLCTNARPWTLQATFSRRAGAPFAPQDGHTFRQILIPPDGTAQLLVRTAVVHGVEIRLCAVGGRGSITYSNGVPIAAMPLPNPQAGFSVGGSSRARFGQGTDVTHNVRAGHPHALVHVGNPPSGRHAGLWASPPGTNRILSATASFGGYWYVPLSVAGETNPVDVAVTLQKQLFPSFQIETPPLPQAPALTVNPAVLSRQIPARPSEASPALLNIDPAYTASLQQWLHASGPIKNGSRSVAFSRVTLTPGIHELNGIPFDVRGVVQLSGLTLKNSGEFFPTNSALIPVNAAGRAIHFLHSAVWAVPDGTRIGHYSVHYADGSTEEVPVNYGEHLREWSPQSSVPGSTSKSVLAWRDPDNGGHALWKMTWTNPKPTLLITHLTAHSRDIDAAPFLIAATLEP